jgi:hypothetical protein
MHYDGYIYNGRLFRVRDALFTAYEKALEDVEVAKAALANAQGRVDAFSEAIDLSLDTE